MTEFVPNRGGPRYNMHEERGAARGPDNDRLTRLLRKVDGPSYVEDSTHSYRDWAIDLTSVVLRDDEDWYQEHDWDEMVTHCQLRVVGYKVYAQLNKTKFKNGYGFSSNVVSRYNEYPSVSAIVSAHVARGNENDQWVVKVVYCPEAQEPHVKTIQDVFTKDWKDNDEERTRLYNWVKDRHFDLLLEHY
jgi:hypothetical protein